MYYITVCVDFLFSDIFLQPRVQQCNSASRPCQRGAQFLILMGDALNKLKLSPYFFLNLGRDEMMNRSVM